MAAADPTRIEPHRDPPRPHWLLCVALPTLLLVVVALGLRSDLPTRRQQPPPTNDSASASDLDSWVGVYSSPQEIGGFSGTVLAIEKTDDELYCRQRSYSDVVISGGIEQDVQTGTCLVDGNRIFIPEASGYYYDGKPQLHARVERMTRASINGRVVLLRDDARETYESENKLYDYGILIKVADEADSVLDLDAVKHESIKVLYADKTKEWRDPYVHGPNER